MFEDSRPEASKFLVTFECGHSRKTLFRYASKEPKWTEAYCAQCHTVMNVTEMAPAYNSKEVE